VERQGVPVRTACKAVNVSPSTYYRLKKIRDEKGVKALRAPSVRKDEQLQQVPLEEQKKILHIVVHHPDYGVTRIVDEIRQDNSQSEVNEKMVYHELKRLRLTTREAREAYAAKKNVD
jgi:transposase